MPRIDSIGLARLTLRLRGVFRIAYSAEATATVTAVAVRLSDGTVGYGEASPAPAVTWENTASVEAYVRSIAGRLKGLDIPGQLGEALRRVHGFGYGFSSAKAALETAVLDAAARVTGVKLYNLLGGKVVERIVTDYTVSIPDPETVRAVVERRGRPYEAYVESIEYLVGLRGEPPEDAPVPLPSLQGFTVLKVKVGTGSLEADVALVEAVYEAARGKARIRVDANQAWTPKQAVRAVRMLESKLGTALELVEQPVPAWDLEGLRYVRENVETPIAADEAARSIVEAAHVARLRAADIINIKIMKAGGPLEGARIARLAEAHGLEVMWGCMVETSVGIAEALHAALASPATRYVDLDSPLFLAEDPAEPQLDYRATGSGVEIAEPAEAGLGVKPRGAVFEWL